MALTLRFFLLFSFGGPRIITVGFGLAPSSWGRSCPGICQQEQAKTAEGGLRPGGKVTGERASACPVFLGGEDLNSLYICAVKVLVPGKKKRHKLATLMFWAWGAQVSEPMETPPVYKCSPDHWG